MSRWRAYGLELETAFELPGLLPGTHAPAGVEIVRVQRERVRSRFSGSPTPLARLATDEGEIRVARGRCGDLLLNAPGVAVCHVSADGSRVACAPENGTGPAFARLLFDTVLGTAALCRGRDGLHAAAVLCGDRLVAVTAASGAGKTTLAAELVRRGAILFTDDLLFLSEAGGEMLAHPGPGVLSLPGGRWIEVARPELEARPLSALVFLARRRDGGPPRIAPEPSPAALIGAALDSGAEPERRERRLELLARLARTTAVGRLMAGTAVPASELAGALERWLEAGR